MPVLQINLPEAVFAAITSKAADAGGGKEGLTQALADAFGVPLSRDPLDGHSPTEKRILTTCHTMWVPNIQSTWAHCGANATQTARVVSRLIAEEHLIAVPGQLRDSVNRLRVVEIVTAAMGQAGAPPAYVEEMRHGKAVR
jgi:hypothetical protein